MREHDSRIIASSTRRNLLGAIPTIAVASVLPLADAKAAVIESPVSKVSRLARELAVALDDYADGTMHAKVFPASRAYGGFSLVVSEDALGLSQEAKLHSRINSLQSHMQENYPDKKWRSHIDKDNSFVLVVGDTRHAAVVTKE